MRNYCEAWTDEHKEAERQRFRAECRVRCLESQLDRIDPHNFESLMDELEQAMAFCRACARRCLELQLKEG